MPNALLNLIKTLLGSKRVQATIVALLLAYFQKSLPFLAGLTETQVAEMVALVIGLVISDGRRPIDPTKAARQADDADRMIGRRG